MRNRKLFVALATCTANVALFAHPAYAQSSGAASSSRALEEVIVTAQKRVQSVSDVGMSVNAVTGDQLAAQGIDSAADLQRIVPAFYVVPPGATVSGAPVYTLRGVGYNARNLSALSAVGVYVDEVPLPYSYMTSGLLLDLERVEVLKGPQGTLYGQNSTGGTINYIAQKPTAEFAAGISASVGRFNERDISGFVSGPLTSKVGARLALRSLTADGWQESISRSDTLGAKEAYAGRLIIDVEASDALNFQLNVNAWKDRSESTGLQITGFNPANEDCFNGTGIGCIVQGLGSQYNLYDELLAFPQRGSDNRAADWDEDVDYSSNNRMHQASVRADWEIYPDVTFTSITAYSEFRMHTNRDIDGLPYFNSLFMGRGKIEAFNQEARLSGIFGDKLDWIVGANYSNDEIQENNSNPAGGTTIGQAFGIDNTLTNAAMDRKGWAVFASSEYALAADLSVTAGIRYTEIEMDFAGCSADPGDGSLLMAFAGTAGPGDCITYLDVSSTVPNQGEVIATSEEDNVSWRLGLNWNTTDDLLLYANVSRGYKSGDIPAITALLESQLQPVKQEEVTAYEIGGKATLFDGRMQLNGAAFYYDYRDKQLQTSVQTFLGIAEQTVNIPKSTVIGGELELTYRPIDPLTLRAGVGYTDTEIRGSFPTFTANTSSVWPPAPGFNSAPFEDVGGDPFNAAPTWQGNVDAQYDWRLPNGMGTFVGASASYAGSTLTTIGAADGLRQESYTLIDLRAGLTDSEGRWQVMIYGQNVTDEHYSVGALRGFDVSGLLAGMPATWGIKLDVTLF